MLRPEFRFVIRQLPQPGVGVLGSEVIAIESVVALEDHHHPLGDRA